MSARKERRSGVRAGTGPAPTEVAGGYADIYLQPRLGVYPDMAHSYVLELKYLPGRATDADVARAQACIEIAFSVFVVFLGESFGGSP